MGHDELKEAYRELAACRFLDGRCPSFDSLPLLLRATAANFQQQFGAREVCRASQADFIHILFDICFIVYQTSLTLFGLKKEKKILAHFSMVLEAR